MLVISARRRHDNGKLIYLTRAAVNKPNPSMKSERVVL
jgi:hypothetical protein